MSDFIFSIVMAIYNSENYLEEAIESVINQTFDFELGGECTDTPPGYFYSVYSETDNSLRFFDSSETITEGSTITTGQDGDVVATQVTKINNNKTFLYASQEPWYSYKNNIVKVVVEDEISPISIKRWFDGLSNVSWR